jgi:GNAT superfamily N-acetyltransferase
MENAIPDSALAYAIRSPIPSDEKFVYKVWLDSYRVTGPMVKQVRDRIFFAYHHRVIEHILARPTTSVLVASPEDAPEVIYGYLVCEPEWTGDEREGIIHWLYVKSSWRRLGIATALLAASGIDPSRAFFTHWTNYEIALNAKREAAKTGKPMDWKTLREVKAKMAADRQAQDRAEGDTRVLIKKWPDATYNPFLAFM